MGSAHAVGHPGGTPSHRPSALKLALGLDAASVAICVPVFVFLTVAARGAQDTGGGAFFSNPLLAMLILAAAAAVIAGGIVATVSLVREPLRSRAGRWATGFAAANALLLPVAELSLAAADLLPGIDVPQGTGQPIVPFWMLAGVAAAILGARAKDPGRRGLLVVPVMLGAFVLVFAVGEFI